jgi:3-oxoacyl-[acyl-carrier protein] reductase
MDLGLRERVAIVGVSSKGIGKAAALALAREGASVTICGPDEADLRRAEIDIARVCSQHHVLAVPADPTRLEDIKRVVRGSFNRFGRIDISVNNIDCSDTGRPSELDDERFGDVLGNDLLSVVRMSREVVPFMKQQQWGRIINRLSISVKESTDEVGLSTSNRMAVMGYARMLALELAPFNITVNNILPGPVLTEQLTTTFETQAQDESRTPGEIMKEAATSIPMGRLGKPGEIGDFIAFLASERAGYITGASIPLDGGAMQAALT